MFLKQITPELKLIRQIYLSCLVNGKTVGSIQVEGFGEIFLLAPDWATIEVREGVKNIHF